jgi:hypothetical protein
MIRRILLWLVFFSSLAWASTWTATVTSLSTDNRGNAVIGVHFDDGLGRQYDVPALIQPGASPTALSDFVAFEESQLDAQKTAFSAAPVIGSTITPTAVVGPSVDLQAAIKKKFIADYLLMRQMERAVHYGLIPSTDTLFVAITTTTANEFIVSRSTVTPLIPVSP